MGRETGMRALAAVIGLVLVASVVAAFTHDDPHDAQVRTATPASSVSTTTATTSSTTTEPVTSTTTTVTATTVPETMPSTTAPPTSEVVTTTTVARTTTSSSAPPSTEDTASITGRFVDEQGQQPITSACGLVNEGGQWTKGAKADANGNFRVDGLAPGTATLYVTANCGSTPASMTHWATKYPRDIPLKAGYATGIGDWKIPVPLAVTG